MHESIWKKVALPHFPSLTHSRSQLSKVDCVIIGGGITGLLTAYLLKKAGQKVCLLERYKLTSGDTGSTTAHLTSVLDTRLSKLVKGFGEENTRLIWEAGEYAIQTIGSIAAEHGIDCQFRFVPGFLHASLDAPDKEASEMESFKEEALLAAELGIDADYETAVPIVGRPGIRFEHQAKFHPLAFLSSLAALIPGQGSYIFEDTEVTSIDKDPLVVHTGKKSIVASHIIVATNVPLMGIENVATATLYQTKIASYSSYVLGASLPKDKYPEVCLWDTSDPYYYLRIDRGIRSDRVIFGGKDHKTGQVSKTENCFLELEKVLKKVLPDAKVNACWTGQLIETHDGLPFIGEFAKGQFAATGYCGNGFTFGALAALMAQDWVLGKKNPWVDIFSPHRKEIHAGGIQNYLRENMDYPIYMIKDWLKARDSFSPEKLKRGEGKVFNLDGKKVACSRSNSGEIELVSAVCTHMGGIVHWNSSEKTWDCPCHGSRFSTDGKVLAGPAEEPLEAIPDSSERKKTG